MPPPRGTSPGRTEAGGHARGHTDGSGWRVVAALAITQTVGYGVLYYAFAVLLLPMAAGLHASTAAVTGALTASVLAGAVMAVPVGRWLDRHGGRALMTVGSIVATALVVAWSGVHTLPQLYGVLIGIGVTTAMVLYEPAFAVLVARTDPARRAGTLLAVTVVAGFASSIFLPVTGLLVQAYGWRTTLLILAAIHGGVTIPLHALAVPRLPGAARHRRPRERIAPVPAGAPHAGADRRDPARRALLDPTFWIMAVVFVANTAAISTLTVHLVGLLTARGHPPAFGAAVAGLFGVLSVTGRLVLTGAQRRIPVTTVVAVIFAVQAAAALLLAAVGASRPGAVIAVTGFGLGFGVATLARPALLADRYGTAGYATIAGLLTVPVTLAKAVAPLAAALLLRATGGYGPLLAAVAACCAVAALGILRIGRAPAHPGAVAAVRPPCRSLAGQPAGPIHRSTSS